MIRSPDSPLQRLSGLATDDGWIVGELVQPQSFQTGSCFSVGYLADHPDGRTGFLKALDFSRAMGHPDPARALQEMTSTYNFERDVLALCRGARLSRVVTAITDGSLAVKDAPLGRVFYLIFELADGDVRKHAVLSNKFDIVWTLRAIHHIATGLHQLHSNGVYHQDVKPSNVLTFGGGKESKLADLGRAHCAKFEAPHDILEIPGQPYYAPVEQLYGFRLEDSQSARAAADLYLLGSMICYLFLGQLLTPMLMDYLREEHKPRILSRFDGGWQGEFAGVLPYLRDAHAKVCASLHVTIQVNLEKTGNVKPADELLALFSSLTDPDPRVRGHVAERRMAHGNPFSLTRFVSAFDRLALNYEVMFKRFNAEAARA